MTGDPRHHRVVRAKLVPARVPEGLLVRDRLLEMFSLTDRFTLLSALPGYGKTAAVGHWIETISAPVAWLSIDLLDQEPAAFWSNILSSLGSVIAGIDEEPAMLLRERGVENPVFLGALVAGLADLESPVLLVLDGLNDDLDAGVFEGLALLVERAGEQLRLVVTSRADPQLPIPRWQALGWVNVIREDALRLTDDEALGIADRTDTSIRDRDELIALNRRVDRWPIGFHMALISRPADGATLQVALSVESNPVLAHYLVGEVLDAITPDERSVALSLSVLDQFDPDLCAQLVGPEALEVVRRLLRRGMFLSVVDPRTGLMRFHDLFRELMETELGYRDPAVRIELHRRAAVLWQERGDLMSAYHHLKVIGETDKAHKLLVDPTLELVDRGELDQLHRLARQLPTTQQVTDPNLAADLALVSLYTDGTLAARRWCDRVSDLADEADPDLDFRLHALRCNVALLDADLDAALEILDTHRLALTNGADPFVRRFPILAARVMMAARRELDADEWIGLAERLAGPEIVTEVTVPTLRAWHEWMFGSLKSAVGQIEGALTWVEDHRLRGHPLAFDTLITGGWCRLSIGDIVGASRLAERAMVDAETIGYSWNQLQAGYLAARMALITGEPSSALRIVDGLRDAVPFESCRPYSDRLWAMEIGALAAGGRAHDAIPQIERLEPGPRTQILKARLVATSDREVDGLLADREAWPGIERLQAELLVSARRIGSDPPPELTDLIAQCAEEGWVLPFLDMGQRVERLLRGLPLHELHPQLARTLDYLAPTPLIETAGDSGVRLTSRELSLVELLPTHLSNAQIGEELFLSVNTVKSNLKAIYRKLGATTRAEAVEAAKHLGFI